ncbi:class I SAM-dependent methyltransferase [Ornithinibacillus bavariensis]|uniref:Methyltransferase n=1 Tax=Ornithinibacillus bavariensis TaxID=545502 RepID=A0A919X663_9BACI|nr:class I SAM-dependent methyltransferase [Ornithinibacillus bavariensis]GIO25754.1 methyltransferase [Ornithinibacillus bavariensis]
MKYSYLDALAILGVGGAHPGGLELTKKIFSTMDIKNDTTILDSGCGTGQTSAFLAQKYGCKITSIDNNELMIEKAKKRFEVLNLPVQVMVANTESLPFANQSFTIVLSESVIAFTDLAKTLREFKRVLKPSGSLIAVEMVLERPLLAEEIEKVKHFYQLSRILTIEEWLEEFKQAGFQHVTIEKDYPSSTIPSPENTPDFTLSDGIEEDVFMVMEYHKQMHLKFQSYLGYRIFRCS